MNLNLKKAYEEIRLDDSPDSPVYTIDLTDEGINKKSAQIVGCWAAYEQLIKHVDEDTPRKIVSIYKQIVDAMLGEGAFKDICDYMGHDVEPEQMLSILSPLVGYLLELFNDVLTANHNKAVEKYLETDAQES